MARVRATFRRLNQTSVKAEIFSFDDVQVNFSTMELHREGQLVPFTPQELKMLRFFLNNQERVVSRTELLNEVWGYNNYPTTRTVDTHMLRLRQKLERDPGEPVHFRTVYGTGYKFVSAVSHRKKTRTTTMILLALMSFFTPISAFPTCGVDERIEIDHGSTYCEPNQPVNPLLPVLWKI